MSTPNARSGPATTVPQSLVITPDLGKVLRAYVFNPEFTPCYPTAQETYLEEILEEEVIRSRLVTRDATPVAFVVPDGCDSIDLLYSPIELNPGVGIDDDLNQVVLVSDAKLSANLEGIDGPLTPGDQVIVTVPWRAASWVDMPAGTLRMQVMAHFYKSPTIAPMAQ